MKVDQLLKQHHLKRTSTRIDVLSKYLQANRALSHSELEKMMGADYDRVTLYRTLKSFEDSGLLHKVYDENGTVRFSTCSDRCHPGEHKDNHVHLHCVECQASYCLDNVSIPKVDLPADIPVHDIYMVVNGTCNNCRRA